MQRSRSWAGRSLRQGVSLVEVVIVIAVLGVLAALVLPELGDLLGYTQDRTAKNHLARLNNAVTSYSQSVVEIDTAANGGTSDEMTVIALLKARDESVPGTPFLPNEWTATATSEDTEFRAQWNGYAFQLLYPGTSGSGLLLKTR